MRETLGNEPETRANAESVGEPASIANAFSVRFAFFFLPPGCSNPGLKLANAFGVFKLISTPKTGKAHASCKAAAFCPYNPDMPIYEYECRKCKAHTEAFQKVTDKPLTKCLKCGGRLEKRISAPAIQFKGSGWYVTDYGKATKDSKSESETQTKSEKSEKSESSDKKTAKESSSAKKAEKPSAPKTSSSD